MQIWRPRARKSKANRWGCTLHEVVCSSAIAGITIGGLLSGQNLAYKRMLWSAASVSAQVVAMDRLEQARAAKWDQMANPSMDELVASNFPDQVVPLSVPGVAVGEVSATSQVSLSNISDDPPLRMIQVQVTWSLWAGRTFTNSIFAYRSPDQ